MEKSSSSGSSTNRWRNRSKGRVSGIPKSCWCGAGIVEKIYGTVENPCRRYYRCWFAYSQKLKDDPHVFKWVDEAFQNEITQLEYQVSVLEEEVQLLKTASQTNSSLTVTTSDHVTGEALKELETYVLRNVEELMDEAAWKMKKMILASIIGTVVVVGVCLYSDEV